MLDPVVFTLGTSERRAVRIFENGERVSDLSGVTRWIATLSEINVDSDSNAECFDWTTYEDDDGSDLLVLLFGTLDLPTGPTSLYLRYYDASHPTGKQLDSSIPALVQGAASGLPPQDIYYPSTADVAVSGHPGHFLTEYFDGGIAFDDLITKGPWVDVRAYGAKCDGTTDDTSAVNACIAAASSYSTILIPGLCKVTSEISLADKGHLTFQGIGSHGSGFTSSTAGLRSIISLLGSKGYMVFRNIGIQAPHATDYPKALIILGRAATGDAPDNTFEDFLLTGSCSKAMAYSIASEGNSWRHFWIKQTGGTGLYALYTSETDDLSLGGFTTNTNLTSWYEHFGIYSTASASASSALIYVQNSGSGGNFTFRDGYLAATNGSGIELGGTVESPPNLFDSILIENNGGGMDYGVKFSGTTTTSQTFRNIKGAIHPAWLFYGVDGNSFNYGSITGCKTNSDYALSLYSTFASTIEAPPTGEVDIRNTLNASEMSLTLYNTPSTIPATTTYGSVIKQNGTERKTRKTLTTNSATPDVSVGSHFQENNSSPTTITNFTGHYPYQEILVTFDTSNTTIGFSAAGYLRGNGGAPWNAPAGSSMRCVWNEGSGFWSCITSRQGGAQGVSGAIATGATVSHGLGYTPTVVILQPMDGTPTAFYPSALGSSTFTVNFTGGGSHAFSWRAE